MPAGSLCVWALLPLDPTLTPSQQTIHAVELTPPPTLSDRTDRVGVEGPQLFHPSDEIILTCVSSWSPGVSPVRLDPSGPHWQLAGQYSHLISPFLSFHLSNKLLALSLVLGTAFGEKYTFSVKTSDCKAELCIKIPIAFKGFNCPIISISRLFFRRI